MIARRKPLPRPTKPIARGPAPARRTRMKQRRATPRRSGRVLNPAFLDFVRGLPCELAPHGECSSWKVEADHAGERPLGRKADDDTAIPMCGGPGHHRQRTDYSGYFKGWSATAMRQWADQKIAKTRAAYARWQESIAGDPPW